MDELNNKLIDNQNKKNRGSNRNSKLNSSVNDDVEDKTEKTLRILPLPDGVTDDSNKDINSKQIDATPAVSYFKNKTIDKVLVRRQALLDYFCRGGVTLFCSPLIPLLL